MYVFIVPVVQRTILHCVVLHKLADPVLPALSDCNAHTQQVQIGS